MRPFFLLTGVVFTLLVTSCSPGPGLGELTDSDFFEGLFSTRPTVEEPFMTIVRLSAPALLESAEKENGVLVYDPEALERINKEQAQTIEELKKLSSEIQIVFTYKSVLNGLAIWAPGDVYEKLKSIPNITLSEKAGQFARLELSEKSLEKALGPNTSVSFIGVQAAYKQNIRGQGMRVGIIDTGIDYTHKMFLGEGTEEAYKAINPGAATSAFPNQKVVGGIDLAGSEFSAGSPVPSRRLPKPDPNPLDESGHGTHVAGTVAGIGDGVNTYSGVAPDAKLYAIKVFGNGGSTSDEVVIAALEYAVDPHQDLSYKDQLDVVNLSLGGGYGNPHIMYAHAIKNITKAGTIVVASAGNSGDQPYIVGAPSVSDDAISVASSIDNADHNVIFPAALFETSQESLKVEVVEGAISKPLSEIESLKGTLVDMGYGNEDPKSPEKISGNIALIERGLINFSEKIKRAKKFGAIAVVVFNNNDEPPFVMGGDDNFDIPAVMISNEIGEKLREQLESSVVSVDLKPQTSIQKPWLIDTISDFSSRGPRSEDGIIKPEIAAPGTGIISAEVGSGDKGKSSNGTSMAGPHIAGAMALLKQKFPELDASELKSVLLGQAKVISDENKERYSVSRQGAGRVQLAESLKTRVVSIPATLSYGITDIEKQKTMSIMLTLKNISNQSLTLTPSWSGSEALKVSSSSITLDANDEKTIAVKATIDASKMAEANEELEGFLTFKNGATTAIQIPALVVVRKISQVKIDAVKILASSEADSAGSVAKISLSNKGLNAGPAYLFNLLGKDTRKFNNRPDYFPNRNCDLQSAGYRILENDGQRTLQFALKLYEGMTTWHTCEVNVQIDADGDNKPDQEIAGLPSGYLPGLGGDEFISLLLDGNKARELRQKYEKELSTNIKATEDYSNAVIDTGKMHVFDNSTLAIIEADVSQLALSKTGELRIKVSTTHQDAGILEYDDYLGKHATQWKKISVHPLAQSYTELPEVVEIDGKSKEVISVIKGYGSERLIMYAPQNKSVRDILLTDDQSQIVEPLYSEE